ncbi:oligosaccharide flippase family protein [Candidatus Woesearchaeota archaeon]|nr:oligosaccharide flippase family protein [Candidatus Woesearchaeota archaeon]
MDSGISKVARGAGIIFLGAFVLYIFRFCYKLLVSRYLGPEDFGLFSLGLMVVNISSLLATVGLNNGIVKFIAHYNGLGDKERVKGTLIAALKTSGIISSIIVIILVSFSPFIAEQVFHNQKLRWILLIMVLSIPAFTMLKLIGKAFTAFKKPEYNIYSNTFGKESISLFLVGVIILIEGSVLSISITFLVSALLALIIAFFLLNRVSPLFQSNVKPIPEYKELMRFSLPLFLSAVFIDIVSWTDTFMLGYLADATAVGIYNIALSLSGTAIIFLATFSSIFFPIIAELKANEKVDEIAALFSVVARWIFFTSLPFFLLLVLSPSSIIKYLFGEEYLPAALSLIILLGGTFASVMSGPTEEVLKTFERLKFILSINISVALLNITLNIVLIPLYGLMGAAIATATAIFLREVIFLFETKRLLKFHYQGKYYLKYIASGIITLGLGYSYLQYAGTLSFVKFMLFSIFFISIYFLSALFLRAIAVEDQQILLAIERKFGIDLGKAKKIVKRFM